MAEVHECEGLRDREGVFEDRWDAAERLAAMLAPHYEGSDQAIILAIPAGGVPVGLVLARRLDLPLDLLLVRKLKIPGNTEAGFAATGLDGNIFYNRELMARLGLGEHDEEVEREREAVMEDLRERNLAFRGGEGFPDVSGKTCILADDGLASGFTMRAGVNAVRKQGAARVVVAVPTSPWRTIEWLRGEADEVYCANVRTSWTFAVASAYRQWRDLERPEVMEMLRRHRAGKPDRP
ncbi:phosphoribosyltransferase [Desulfohalovibrio reitneri]|uniref:phosphoribosyltransferase n=1 Tax=Desulfohalovibrio reitneri TaxID=1307759 RepID=UPI0004A73FD0|nr:phosphoribosyltransferase family protein [Desulfohalovibrio reitneri]